MNRFAVKFALLVAVGLLAKCEVRAAEAGAVEWGCAELTHCVKPGQDKPGAMVNGVCIEDAASLMTVNCGAPGTVPNCFYGMYANPTKGKNQPKCLFCPGGMFGGGTHKKSYEEACEVCPINTFADAMGLKECKPCPAGRHAPVVGATACVPKMGTRCTDDATCQALDAKLGCEIKTAECKLKTNFGPCVDSDECTSTDFCATDTRTCLAKPTAEVPLLLSGMKKEEFDHTGREAVRAGVATELPTTPQDVEITNVRDAPRVRRLDSLLSSRGRCPAGRALAEAGGIMMDVKAVLRVEEGSTAKEAEAAGVKAVVKAAATGRVAAAIQDEFLKTDSDALKKATPQLAAPLLLAARVPALGTPTATADGFTVVIGNYDDSYTWTAGVTGGGAAAAAAVQGHTATVTNMDAGLTAATLTVTSSKTGYKPGSASVDGHSNTLFKGPTDVRLYERKPPRGLRKGPDCPESDLFWALNAHPIFVSGFRVGVAMPPTDRIQRLTRLPGGCVCVRRAKVYPDYVKGGPFPLPTSTSRDGRDFQFCPMARQKAASGALTLAATVTTGCSAAQPELPVGDPNFRFNGEVYYFTSTADGSWTSPCTHAEVYYGLPSASSQPVPYVTKAVPGSEAEFARYNTAFFGELWPAGTAATIGKEVNEACATDADCLGMLECDNSQCKAIFGQRCAGGDDCRAREYTGYVQGILKCDNGATATVDTAPPSYTCLFDSMVPGNLGYVHPTGALRNCAAGQQSLQTYGCFAGGGEDSACATDDDCENGQYCDTWTKEHEGAAPFKQCYNKRAWYEPCHPDKGHQQCKSSMQCVARAAEYQNTGKTLFPYRDTANALGYCDGCPKGQYRGANDNMGRAGRCIPCAIGKYSDVLGATLCKNCAAGHETLRTGATDGGSGANVAKAGECVGCKPGMYNRDGGDACDQCEPNKYSKNTGATLCIESPCTPGKYHHTNQVTGLENTMEMCKTCAKGTFDNTPQGQHIVGAMGCKTCASGKYQDKEGQTECTDMLCPQGTGDSSASNFLRTSKDATCTACASGKHNNGDRTRGSCQ